MNNALLMSLPHAVDMSLRYPEIGAVNFNLLNTVLQVMIHKLKLDDCTIEIRDPGNERLQSLAETAPPTLSVKVSDYAVSYDPWKKQKEPQPTPSLANQKGPKKSWNIVVVEPSKDTDTGRQSHTVVPISNERFEKLETNIDELKSKMREILELPTDSNIVEAMRSMEDRDTVPVSTLTPAGEMWQLLSLSKRMDAAEAGITQLSNTMDAFMNEVSEAMYYSPTYYSSTQLSDSCINDTQASVMNTDPQGSDSKIRTSRPSIFVNVVQRLETIEKKNEEVIHLKQEMEYVKRTVSRIESHVTDAWERIEDFRYSEKLFNDLMRMEERLNNLEEDQNQVNKNLKELSTKCIDLQDHVLVFEQELGSVLEHVNSVAQPDEVTYLLSVATLSKQVRQLEDDVEKLSTAAQQITEEQIERKLAIDNVREELQEIKVEKVDRLLMDEALLEKADTDIMQDGLNRKVSHHQVERFYEELMKSVEDATDKLRVQEKLWYQTLEEIQTAVSRKIDKIDELEPLRHSVNDRIKTLQGYIRFLCESKAEQDAAATKKRLLRDINCISCDRPAVMKKYNEHSLYPTPPVMSGKPSMKAQLTYKLSDIRTQNKCLNQGQQMGNAMREMRLPRGKCISKAWRPGQSCNRYSGGSHTITTAQQRVPHVGQHLDQVAPEVIALKTIYMTGFDGKVYKCNENTDVRSCTARSKAIQTTASRSTNKLQAPRQRLTSSALKFRRSVRPTLHSISEELEETMDATPPMEIEEPSESVKGNDDTRTSMSLNSLLKLHMTKQPKSDSVPESSAKRTITKRGSVPGTNTQPRKLFTDDPLNKSIPTNLFPDPNVDDFGNRAQLEDLLLVNLEILSGDKPSVPDRDTDKEKLEE